MPDIKHITHRIAVAAQLKSDDFAILKAAGFRAIVANRPDEEEGDFVRAAEAQALAEAHGLEFRYVPAEPNALFEDDILDAFAHAIDELPEPVLGYCKSGTRSAILWALVQSRAEPVASVIEALDNAGIDLAFLKDELEHQAAAAKPDKGGFKDGLQKLGGSPLTH